MRKLIAASIAGLLVLSAPLARGEPEGNARCPGVHDRETRETYTAHRRDYCDARWRRLVAASATRGETHDQFMDRCERKCVAALWPVGALGGILLAGGVAGLVAASGGEDRPASP